MYDIIYIIYVYDIHRKSVFRMFTEGMSHKNEYQTKEIPNFPKDITIQNCQKLMKN